MHSQCNCLQIIINRLIHTRIGNHTAEILVVHGNGTVHQIAQNIRQI